MLPHWLFNAITQRNNRSGPDDLWRIVLFFNKRLGLTARVAKVEDVGRPEGHLLSPF